MLVLRSLLRAVPRPLRRALRRVADRCVPLRWQLPYISAKLYLQGGLEEELLWLPRILRERGGVAIDVGANIGLYSYRLARLCGRVEAFEPNPVVLRVLEAYRAANIRTHCVALSSRAGTRRLNIPVVGGLPQSELGSIEPMPRREVLARDVATRALDEYGFAEVAFVKIDVEGHELDVLEGGRETIRRCLPVLQVEIEERYHSTGVEVALDRFIALGYMGCFIFGGSLRPIDEFRPEFHQRGYLEGRQATKYVNNFLFLPPGWRNEGMPPAGASTR